MRNAPALVLALFGLCLPACRSEAKQAELADVEIRKVDAACATGDRDKAVAAMEEAARQNAAFGSAYEKAMADVPNKAQVNPCGLILADVKLRLDRMKRK